MLTVWNFYKNLYTENTPWLKQVTGWFAVSFFAGIAGFFVYPSLFEDILKMFENKFGADPDLDHRLASQIFQQNATASAMALVGGLLLGIGPFLVVVVNGFLIGFVVSSVMALSGADLWTNMLFLVMGLVPHGIFELPAFLLAAAVGLRWGVGYLYADKGQKWQAFKQASKAVIYWIPVIIVMLLIAAWVEVFVSGNLVGN